MESCISTNQCQVNGFSVLSKMKNETRLLAFFSDEMQFGAFLKFKMKRVCSPFFLIKRYHKGVLI
jgi:hypothetical protein